MSRKINRCDWAEHSELLRKYHDEKWGLAEFDDDELFKMLCLEIMQAGLSWHIILKKMETLLKAFDNFNPKTLMHYGDDKVNELLQNEGIIRHEKKIRAVISNAEAYNKLCDEFGSLSKYLWAFVNNKPIINSWKSHIDVPSSTGISDKISKDLKKRGFKFVGSTVVYSFMQASGMVNDHLLKCDFRSKSH